MSSYTVSVQYVPPLFPLLASYLNKIIHNLFSSWPPTLSTRCVDPSLVDSSVSVSQSSLSVDPVRVAGESFWVLSVARY